MEVRQFDDHVGMLTVFMVLPEDWAGIIHRQAVHVSFDGLFGPPAADIVEWQRRTLEVIDHYRLTNELLPQDHL